MSVTVKVDGFDDLYKRIRRLDDKMKRKEVLKLLKKQAKPVQTLARANTPRAGKTITRYYKDGTVADVYESGNLAKSIKIKAVRASKVGGNPYIWLGPVAGDKKNDGFYGWFLIRGTKHIAARKNWIHQAFHTLDAGNKTMEEVRRYLTNQAKKLGLDAK